MSKKRKAAETDRGQKDFDYNFDVEEVVVSKRNSLEGLTSIKRKCERVGISKIRQCSSILMKLMNHPFGWVFNQPVDPVKLNYPDYFYIISKPMDLGTIRHKLTSNLYSSTHQFAADVRLTFSNAMQYNHLGNDVHTMAKELDNIFNSAWKSLEGHWRKGNSNLGLQAVSLRPVGVKGPFGCSNLSSWRSMAHTEKLKLRKGLANMPIRKMPPWLRNFLQKELMLEKTEVRINLESDMHDEVTLLKMHQMLNCSVGAKLPEIVIKCGGDSAQESCKGSGETTLMPGDAKVESLLSSARADATCATCNGSSSQQFPGGEQYSQHSVSCDLEHKKALSGIQLGDPSCELDGNNNLPFEELLSPNRAIRAAMLKSRFADTIAKAQRTLLDHEKKIDPANLQLEREKFERRQQEEKARIEAQVKAAELDAQKKAEAEMKMQREREREAARLALERMEKTVQIDNNDILNDIKALSCCQEGITMYDGILANYMYGVDMRSGPANPLEQLGLFLKNDDLKEEAEEWISAVDNVDNGHVEDGKISCLWSGSEI